MAGHLLEELMKYSASDAYPLHMPGHKRRISMLEHPYAIDITEIEGFDNLHHAEGLLLEAQQRAAALYGADETFYLVNGSTCGILSAVAACVPRGGRILMARNCHKAVYHAVFLNGLRASYLYPEMDAVRGISGAIQASAVREALKEQRKTQERQENPGKQAGTHEIREAMAEQPDIAAVLVTSPTYDGVVSDIRSIAKEVHAAGAVLIVDEAHGAHFAMHPYFPDSALACGADIVINSLHKTLPSLTQTALLHVQDDRVDRRKLRKYLGIYQTSSPSYVLMAGMDGCIDQLTEQGRELFDGFTGRLALLRKRLQQMRCLHLVEGAEDGLDAFAYDCSKVLISTERAAISGPELADILRREYHLEPEMAAPGYVTAILTIGDTEEGFSRLEQALLEIDERLQYDPKTAVQGNGCTAGDLEKENNGRNRGSCTVGRREGRNAGACTAGNVKNGAGTAALYRIQNEEVLTIEEAESSPCEVVRLQESAGHISAEFVYLYPPGIPLLVPGERISEELLAQLAGCQTVGLELQGLADHTGETISVVRE
jgi:arginine/lysine/ornithine decarboxylase